MSAVPGRSATPGRRGPRGSLVAALCGFALMGAACSSGGSSPSSTSSSAATTTTAAAPGSGSSPTPAAQTFLSAADSVDAAYTMWKTAADNAATVSSLAQPAATYAAALTTFDATVGALSVTAKTETDAQALIRADRTVISLLESAGTQTSATASAWMSTLRADGNTAVAASNTVRTDLGLPPAPSS